MTPLSSGAVFVLGFLSHAVVGPQFGQLSSSVTDDRIRFTIWALLGVAALLGLSTVWFFVHTSPRRRARSASLQSGRPQFETGVAPEARPLPVESTQVRDPLAVATDVADVGGENDDDADWLRLTGPEQRADGARRTHG